MRTSSKIVIFIVIIVFVLGGVYLFTNDNNNPTLPDDSSQVVKVNTSTWSSFVSEEYDFKLDYPANDWNKYIALDHPMSPHFNFYKKPQGVPVDTPFIHFANITNFSIFPEGIPTESIIGQTRSLGEGWGDNINREESRVYELDDGTPFAAFIRFKNTPESWTEAGYVWVRLKAENFDSVCYKNGEKVTPEKKEKGESCDPFGSRAEIKIEHKGDVNKKVWPKLKAMVRNIQFVE